MDSLDRYREKWREVPSGAEGRVFSDSLADMPDDAFLAYWSSMATKRSDSVVGRMTPLYADFLRGKRVLELGGGLGFDGMRYAALGAHWDLCRYRPWQSRCRQARGQAEGP